MKKFIFLSLIVALFDSCWEGPESYDDNYNWEVVNETSQDVIIKLMYLEEDEGLRFDIDHSKVTKIGESIKMKHIANPNAVGEELSGFDSWWHWTLYCHPHNHYKDGYLIKNYAKCEIWSADNKKILKKWLPVDLYIEAAGVNEKHFFREEDWFLKKTKRTNHSYTYIWTFTLTDEDIQ